MTVENPQYSQLKNWSRLESNVSQNQNSFINTNTNKIHSANIASTNLNQQHSRDFKKSK
jgi:hypothetical protein